jgi:hypothetical protein
MLVIMMMMMMMCCNKRGCYFGHRPFSSVTLNTTFRELKVSVIICNGRKLFTAVITKRYSRPIIHLHHLPKGTVPWLRPLVSGQSPQCPDFDPGPVFIGFVVDEVAPEQLILRVVSSAITCVSLMRIDYNSTDE